MAIDFTLLTWNKIYPLISVLQGNRDRNRKHECVKKMRYRTIWLTGHGGTHCPVNSVLEQTNNQKNKQQTYEASVCVGGGFEQVSAQERWVLADQPTFVWDLSKTNVYERRNKAHKKCINKPTLPPQPTNLWLYCLFVDALRSSQCQEIFRMKTNLVSKGNPCLVVYAKWAEKCLWRKCNIVANFAWNFAA